MKETVEMKGYGRRDANSTGAALVEFLFVFIFFLLPLTLFLIFFGRTIWQMQYLADAAREAARQGAIYSEKNPDAPCVGGSADGNDYVDVTSGIANGLLYNSPGAWGMKDLWWGYALPVESEHVREFHAGNPSGPSARIVPLRVIYEIDTMNNQCFFCYFGQAISAYYVVMGISDLGYKVSQCPAP